MIRINQIKLPVTEGIDELKIKAAHILSARPESIVSLRVLRRSIEARRKEQLSYVYNAAVETADDAQIYREFCKSRNYRKYSPDVSYPYYEKVYFFPYKNAQQTSRPVVIGSGPAGLFCAYELAKAGYSPLIIERGSCIDERKRKVSDFWAGGPLDEESNVQFGEGGAGTFSDGKLNGGKADREGRSMEVLRLFHECGAREEILYDAMPHVGTDVLETVVRNIRQKITAAGGEFLFDTKAEDIIINDGRVEGVALSDGSVVNTSYVCLAIGHSARDTFKMLYDHGVHMEKKPFAVGLRIIHDQQLINDSQWGEGHPDSMGSAYYKLTCRTGSGRSVYSFCMCPGGYVVNASSQKGHTAVNGMSYLDRASGFANSAIVAAVSPDDLPDSGDVFPGMYFQQEIEKRAFEAAQGQIPVSSLGYLKGLADGDHIELPEAFKGKAQLCDIRNVLPGFLLKDIIEAIDFFDTRIKGFASDNALLCAVESRTSSPVRIVRDDSFQSNIKGLFPCGEGAGYAGGIMSAASDGIKTAEAIAKNMSDMLK